MNARELYDEWTSGESTGMRPKRVQAVRDDLEEAIEMSIPRRIPELEGWLSTMHRSGVITRRLKAAADAEEQDEEVDFEPIEDDLDDEEDVDDSDE